MMVPQGKEWWAKSVEQTARPVEPPQVISLTGIADRSDRPEQPVRPVQPALEQKARVSTSVLNEEVSAVPPVPEDEELVD